MTTTADIDRRRPLCWPSWLSDIGQNPYSNWNERLMEEIHIWNLAKYPIKNDWVRVTTTADIDMWRPFCRPSLLSDGRTKPIFKHEREVDVSNPYVKFGRNLIKNNWVRGTTRADIDMWRPFCRPSWLSDVGQNPYSNLNEKLMEAIHIWNLEEIRLKMSELEWPRTDRQTDRRTDEPKTTFVGGALIKKK